MVLLNDYRIVSIQNEFTEYKFTNIIFPDSKYNFYRIKITDNSENQSEKDFNENEPKIKTANLFLQKTVVGNFENVEISSQTIKIDKEKKQTIIDIQLAHSVPIDFLSLKIKNDFDYYRTIQFKYLLDSTETEKGTIYNFVTFHTNLLSSIENQEGVSEFFIHPNSTIKSNQYQIIIDNQDNQPLDIGQLEMKTYVKHLFTRVVSISNIAGKEIDYFLMYGNEKIRKPSYDIIRFESTIPTDLVSLELEKEQKIPQKRVEKIKALFENSLWLWLLMGGIILVLTVLTFKMMKKQ